MTSYTCRPDSASGKHRLTKLDADFNVEASYLTDAFSCDCPAGKRPSCRHRTMLPEFLTRSRDTGTWFYDYDTANWYHNDTDEGDSVVINLDVAEAPPSARLTSSGLRRI